MAYGTSTREADFKLPDTSIMKCWKGKEKQIIKLQNKVYFIKIKTASFSALKSNLEMERAEGYIAIIP